MFNYGKQRQKKHGIHWSKRMLMSLLAVVLVSGQVIWQAPAAEAAKVQSDVQGATYFVDTDN